MGVCESDRERRERRYREINDESRALLIEAEALCNKAQGYVLAAVVLVLAAFAIVILGAVL